MFGVQAIGSGFVALLALAAVAIAALVGLVAGAVLFWRRTRVAGAACLFIAAVTLFFVGKVALQISAPTLDRLTLDLSGTADLVGVRTEAGCSIEQEWCQVAGPVKSLTILLPGGKRSELRAGSVNVRFGSSTVREVLVHAGSGYSPSELLALLAAEQVNAAQPDSPSGSKFRQAVTSNVQVRSDQSAVFVGDRHVVVVTALPRNSPAENYRVMYQARLDVALPR